MMIKTIYTNTFDSGRPGKSLLVFGAIHGNEQCGTAAIGKIMAEIEAGILTLATGKVTFVPVCNPEAYRGNCRFIEKNLNRVISFHENTDVYEHALANQLVGLIDRHDALLDLHSYSGGTKPFIFLDSDTEEHRKYAAALGIADWVSGWNDAYGTAPENLNGGDTVFYAHSKGKEAVLVECGEHADPAAIPVADRCIRAALEYFGITVKTSQAAEQKPNTHRMTHIIVREKAGDYTQDWKHLQPVRSGEPVIRYDDGDIVAAPYDGVILLPHRSAMLQQEWLYFGKPATT